MAGLLLVKSVQWSPLIQVVILTLGTFLSFTVAYYGGDVSLYLPFISETGAYVPEKCIFSLCLILGSHIGFIVVFCRFMILFGDQLDQSKSFTWLNISSLIIGIISMLGLAGVAAFPMTTVYSAHLVSAAVYFVGSFVYFLCTTIITYKIDGKSKIFIFRSLLTLALGGLLILLIISFPISYVKWRENNSIIPALKKPENEGFALILLSSIIEWSIVGVILAYTLSLSIELRRYSLLITAITEKKSDSATEGLSTVPENFNLS